MDWQIIVALMIAVPIVLLPVLFVWYLNARGIFAAVREARARRVTHKKTIKVVAKAE